jgi:hypothetical protein
MLVLVRGSYSLGSQAFSTIFGRVGPCQPFSVRFGKEGTRITKTGICQVPRRPI